MSSVVRATEGWLSADDCRLGDLVGVVAEVTAAADYPYADAVRQNVPVYDSARLRDEVPRVEDRRAVQAELAHALLDGPGLVVFAGAFDDDSVVDRATDAFFAIIDDQRAGGAVAGDHFAVPGTNDRIWNALEKLARRDPDTFVAYYANDILALVSTAWLGPAYQVTSQVNVVNPGGAAQAAHRDYHLGFLSDAVTAQYPEHVHRLSPLLTLQGAVAQTAMPLDTGPTLYLPHSQKYRAGYLAWRRPEFRAYFDANHVQLPLAQGDAVFFNPALFHAAGTNRSADVRRMGNLLQISSPFGRAMETVDREAMSLAIYPALLAMRQAGAEPRAIDNAIAACAEGYAFPTNLDLDQPLEGLAPPSQADILATAVDEAWPIERLSRELGEWSTRRRTVGP